MAAGAQEHDTTGVTDPLVAGQRVARLTSVSAPTLTLYSSTGQGSATPAVVVFPGGGYQILAWDLEGTEVCHWLNSLGIACALVKYRVPDAGPFPLHTDDLADAQRSVRLVRAHAAEWHIDPKHVGVLGFSAGGHLAAVLGSHAGDALVPAASEDAIDGLSAAPDFAVLIYPAYLTEKTSLTTVSPEVRPSAATPPTFLVQTEDDPVHVENALTYYRALKDADVRAEMHLYAAGGHGYGLRPTPLPVTHWPELAERWFRTVGVLPSSPPAAHTP